MAPRTKARNVVDSPRMGTVDLNPNINMDICLSIFVFVLWCVWLCNINIYKQGSEGLDNGALSPSGTLGRVPA